jgi:glucose-6-phosphate isomerase
MSITAARFGTSPLLLDWSGLRAHAAEPSAADRDQLWATWQITTGKLHDQVSGFYNAVITPELSQVQACVALAQKMKAPLASGNTIKDCIFIGIGGSSLGPMCVLDSLKHLADGKIQFHFFENPDPIDWNYRIQKLSAANTLVCVVTKSGTTYETLSIFMLAYDWLKRGVGPQNASAHTVAITDPEKGELLEFARKENIQTLSIAPCVGGRYSVFTPVGLFAIALAGLSVESCFYWAQKKRA